MLRVHRFEEPYSVRLRIEGALTADVLDAVERSWQEAVADARGRKLLLDASGVIRADAAGIASLGRMASQGARVDDDGRFLPHTEPDSLQGRLRHGFCVVLCAALPMWHGCPCGHRAG